jgi:hypothetical protein
MGWVVGQHPATELPVIQDNLSTHKPEHDRWRDRHPLIHFHYTPTHVSWLNQVEVWSSILTQALTGSLMHVMSIPYSLSGPRVWCIPAT